MVRSIIIVTGASSGLGKALTLLLSKANKDKLIMAISRSSEFVEEFKKVENIYPLNYDFSDLKNME